MSIVDNIREKIYENYQPNETKTSLEEMKKYISKHVTDLNISERKDILQMIINSSIDQQHIQEKGDGTQIEYVHISKNTLIAIYNFIQNKISNKMEALKNFPDD